MPGTVSVPMIWLIGLPFCMKNSPKARPNPALAGRKPQTAAFGWHTSGIGSSCTRFLRDVNVVRNTQLKSFCWMGVIPAAISIPSFHKTPPFKMRVANPVEGAGVLWSNKS